MVEWSQGALKVARDYTEANLELAGRFGNFDSNHFCLVQEDGAMELYDGNLRAIDDQGEMIFDQIDDQRYTEVLLEEVRDWSYMKFPFIRELGPVHGWYRVGPLSRVNACSYIDTPLAEAARREFMAVTDGKPHTMSLAYHWARMIEVVHAIEKIGELLHDPDLQGSDRVTRGDRREEGIGIIEAPRGTLIHHYKVNEDDQVTMCNLIVSTTHNNTGMNTAVTEVAREFIDGVPEITEGLLNHVEVAVRAYDPCLSCATHAVGQMPLVVQIHDAEGAVVAERVKDSGG